MTDDTLAKGTTLSSQPLSKVVFSSIQIICPITWYNFMQANVFIQSSHLAAPIILTASDSNSDASYMYIG
jgi:hypothetical protein